MKRFMRWAIMLAAAMAGLRLIPGLAAAWQKSLAVPLLGALHRLTSALPFPALEPLALVAACLCLNRRFRAGTLAVVLGMVGLLWYPAYFAAPAESRTHDGDTEALCLALTDALNASALDFTAPLDMAGEVAGMPWARVKPVRYPEWMRAMGIAGLFSPWTGEALVDNGALSGYVSFTCVHELQHLRGIADEGAANIAAYRACLAHGGMYADSARLWALRYGLSRLDADARARVTRRMGGPLRALTATAAPIPSSRFPGLLGIGRQTRDYDALVDWLLEEGG